MNSVDALATPTDRILHALVLHDECSRSDLLDAAALKSYPELDAVLVQWGDKVTMHWGECRTYRLAEVKPETPQWKRPPQPG